MDLISCRDLHKNTARYAGQKITLGQVDNVDQMHEQVIAGFHQRQHVADIKAQRLQQSER